MKNKPPREIKLDDIVYCVIKNKIEKCIVVNTMILSVQIFKDKKEYEENHPWNYNASYQFKFWKYGIDWALTKEELEK